ncbi:MAG: hypothetical protein AAF772_21310, partial [Acidobacteriota bacterium]
MSARQRNNRRWVVVDTNVALVANGAQDDASSACGNTCRQRLLDITRGRAGLVLDRGRRIEAEYGRKLRSSGQPGVGDAFLKWVLTNRANRQRCRQVGLTPRSDEPDDFTTFPNNPALADFDRDDRKFVAVARAYGDETPVLQALDSKWWGLRDALARA